MTRQVTPLTFGANVAVGFVPGINGEQIPMPARKFWPEAATGTMVATDNGDSRTYYITLSPADSQNSSAGRTLVGVGRTIGWKSVGFSLPFKLVPIIGQVLGVLWPSPIAKEQFWHPRPEDCPPGAQVTVVLLGF